MPRSFLPTRGIFVPTCLIYNRAFPATLFQTWVQLRGLAWGHLETPVLSIRQLAELTGKSQSCIYGHLTSLRDWGALRWRPSEGGTLIVSFDADSQIVLTPPDSPAPDSRNLEKPDPSLTADSILGSSDLVKKAGSTDHFLRIEDLERGGGSGNSRNLELPDQSGPAGGYPGDARQGRLPEATNPPASPAAGGSRRTRNRQASDQQAGNPAASLYQELTGLNPNRLQRELLAEQVGDLERWGATLEHWLGHGWSPRNITGQLDLYQRGGPGACRQCRAEEPGKQSTVQVLEQMLKEERDFG